MDEEGLSYRTLAASAREPVGVGRNINNFLIKDDASPTVGTVAAAATGLKIELWQLFVPKLSELDRIERKQLGELVDTYVQGGQAARNALMSVLEIRSSLIQAQTGAKEEKKL